MYQNFHQEIIDQNREEPGQKTTEKINGNAANSFHNGSFAPQNFAFKGPNISQKQKANAKNNVKLMQKEENIQKNQQNSSDSDKRLELVLSYLDIKNTMQTFIDNDISFKDLFLLSYNDMVELGFSLVEKNRLMHFSKSFQKYSDEFSEEKIVEFFNNHKLLNIKSPPQPSNTNNPNIISSTSYFDLSQQPSKFIQAKNSAAETNVNFSGINNQDKISTLTSLNIDTFIPENNCLENDVGSKGKNGVKSSSKVSNSESVFRNKQKPNQKISEKGGNNIRSLNRNYDRNDKPIRPSSGFNQKLEDNLEVNLNDFNNNFNAYSASNRIVNSFNSSDKGNKLRKLNKSNLSLNSKLYSNNLNRSLSKNGASQNNIKTYNYSCNDSVINGSNVYKKYYELTEEVENYLHKYSQSKQNSSKARNLSCVRMFYPNNVSDYQKFSKSKRHKTKGSLDNRTVQSIKSEIVDQNSYIQLSELGKRKAMLKKMLNNYDAQIDEKKKILQYLDGEN